MDGVISQSDKNYLEALINYSKILTYKIRLMKKLNVSNLVELIDHGRQKK